MRPLSEETCPGGATSLMGGRQKMCFGLVLATAHEAPLGSVLTTALRWGHRSVLADEETKAQSQDSSTAPAAGH